MKKNRLGLLGTLALCCCLSAGCAGQSCEDKKTQTLTNLLPMDTLYRQVQDFGYQGTYEEFVALIEKTIYEGVTGIDVTPNNEVAIILKNGEQMVVGKLDRSGMAQMQSAYEQAKGLGYQGSYDKFVTLSEDIMTVGIESVFVDTNNKIVLFLKNGKSMVIGELKSDKVNPAVVENGIQYKLNDMGSGYIVVGVEDVDTSVVRIPSVCQNKPVTAIGEFAFAEMRNLQHVYIGANVEEIKAGAFYNCYNLKQLIVPARVGYISASAFEYSGINAVYFEGNVLPETNAFTEKVKGYTSSQWHYDGRGNPVLN
jgi:hypothetical protein